MKRSIVAVLVLALLCVISPIDGAAKALEGGGYTYGGGGPCFFFSRPDFGVINEETGAMGIGALGKNFIMYGGGGWGVVKKNWKIGGMGAGGSISARGKSQGYSRKAEFSLGFGGPTLEYACFPFGLFEIDFGLLIAWGTMSIGLTQNAGDGTWDDIWRNYQVTDGEADHLYTTMERDFFALYPWTGFRVKIFEWLGVGAKAGYFYPTSDAADWEVGGREVLNAPKVTLRHWIYQLSIIFGN